MSYSRVGELAWRTAAEYAIKCACVYVFVLCTYSHVRRFCLQLWWKNSVRYFRRC